MKSDRKAVLHQTRVNRITHGCGGGIALLLGLMIAACAVTPTGQVTDAREAGDRAYAADNHAEAIVHYRAYLAEMPSEPRVWYRLGNALAREGALRQAQDALEQALERDPGLAEARHNLGLVHMQLAWRALLEARRDLPEADSAGAGTMRYLACLMEILAGESVAESCRPPNQEELNE